MLVRMLHLFICAIIFEPCSILFLAHTQFIFFVKLKAENQPSGMGQTDRQTNTRTNSSIAYCPHTHFRCRGSKSKQMN